jgi:hypothetical protein
MDWLKLITTNPSIAIAMPTLLGLLQFVAHLTVALSDGKLDSSEMHTLMSSASGVELILLGVIMMALKINKGQN